MVFVSNTTYQTKMNKMVFYIFLLLSNLILGSHTHFDKKTPSEDKDFKLKVQDTLHIDDGPYVFFVNDSVIEKNILQGTVNSKILNPDNVKTNFDPETSVYNNVPKIAAISDMHGQYNLTIDILKNNGIIDDKLNWSFGNGHLVIVGDIFDRGPKVTELLWFVYNLEKQAAITNGMVHFILGNHEYMIMQDDLRYLNKKYRRVEQLLNMPYPQLYDEKTFMGRWLRSKPTMLKIDDNLFVHGGISPEFIKNDFNFEKTNQSMRQSLYVKEWTRSSDSIYGKYLYDTGPIWYRGYFNPEFEERDLKKILRKLKVKHIIIGHIPHRKIESLFDNKILAIDSSIQTGIIGEMLFIENSEFFRGTRDGEKIKLN